MRPGRRPAGGLNSTRPPDGSLATSFFAALSFCSELLCFLLRQASCTPPAPFLALRLSFTCILGLFASPAPAYTPRMHTHLHMHLFCKSIGQPLHEDHLTLQHMHTSFSLGIYRATHIHGIHGNLHAKCKPYSIVQAAQCKTTIQQRQEAWADELVHMRMVRRGAMHGAACTAPAGQHPQRSILALIYYAFTRATPSVAARSGSTKWQRPLEGSCRPPTLFTL